jgi:hypothetical protein
LKRRKNERKRKRKKKGNNMKGGRSVERRNKIGKPPVYH